MTAPSPLFDLSRLPLHGPIVMGIINVTPDSFSDGGTCTTLSAALRQAHDMARAGAHILDVGGESTRPGAAPVQRDEELRRVTPVFEALAKEQLPVALSVDTYRAATAQACLERGAQIVNDISALGDPDMAAVVARAAATIVLMHMRGTPANMQIQADYRDVVSDVVEHLQARAAAAMGAGIHRGRIWVDPGIGFAKTATHNWELLRHTKKIAALGYPVVIGVSRKKFLGELIDTQDAAAQRDNVTAAVCALTATLGARVFRVHNVAATREALAVAAAFAAPDAVAHLCGASRLR